MARAIFLQGQEGLRFCFDDYESFETQKERLQAFLPKFHRFFPGQSLFVDLGEREKKKEEIAALCEEGGIPVEFVREEEPLEGIKFALRTIRSGQEVRSRGHFVVLGSVNPGGVVVAGGNVVVLGEIRGKVLAGQENPEAFVAALAFSPERLEIGKVVGEKLFQEQPAVVRVEKGTYKIEPLLPVRAPQAG